MGSQVSSRETSISLLPGPGFLPSAFLESACLHDLIQNEKADLPNQMGAPGGEGQVFSSSSQLREIRTDCGPASFRFDEIPGLGVHQGYQAPWGTFHINHFCGVL